MQTKAKDLTLLTTAINQVKAREVGVANSYRLAKLSKEVVGLLGPINEVQDKIRNQYQEDVVNTKGEKAKQKLIDDANAKLIETEQTMIEHDLTLTLEPHDAFTPEVIGTFMVVLGDNFKMNGVE